jgi:hypothetical protein
MHHVIVRALSMFGVAALLVASAVETRAGCRRLCRAAVEDCWTLTFDQPGARRSDCRKSIHAQCRRDGRATCREARARARFCRDECAALWDRCFAAEDFPCADFERMCRTSDAGRFACEEATARGAECRTSCQPIADSCLLALGESICTPFVERQCAAIGPEYCTAEPTVNGCNRLVAEDRRGEPSVNLFPESTCILVSRGTVVDVGRLMIFSNLDFCFSGEADLYDAGCFAAFGAGIVGGSAGRVDPESPFSSAVGHRSVFFETPGIHGYWGPSSSAWGAVIVDDD